MSRMPSAGEVIDDVFRVEEEVDSGNFGSVYRVTDLLENRTLAVKVLRPGTHDEGELRKRFEREATLIYSLKHPHVVQVYYYGETGSGLPYLAMEYLHGTDLRTLLHGYGELHDALTKRITLETLSALEAAGRLGIVHRDLKPANIFLVNDGGKGHVKVLDFGFAKAFDDDSGNELTNAQTLVGTPAYMAPELVHKQNVGPPADLYGMGLILAEMILGKKIIDIENVYDTILFQASPKPIKFPRAIKKSPFYPVIKKACAKDLDERYASATEMIADLRAIPVEGESQEDTSPHMADVNVGGARVFGDADMHAETRPASHGMPSMEEVDRALGHTSGSGPTPHTPRPERHTGGYPAAQTQQPERVRVRHQTPRPSARPHTGPHEALPVDSQYYLGEGGAPADTGRAGAPIRDPHEIDLAYESPIQRRHTGAGLSEVLIGLVFGGLVIGVIVLILTFMA